MSATTCLKEKDRELPNPLAVQFFKIVDTIIYGLACIRDRSLENPPNYFLEKNFKPVQKELFEKDLKFTASDMAVLDEIEGEFVRNGPNPKFYSRLGYHWFDGDGMLHGVRIKDRKINYVNRWTKTNRFKREEEEQRDIYLRLGTLNGILGLISVAVLKIKESFGVGENVAMGTGTANTALAFHDGRLLALVENDCPYAVNMLLDGEFETLGRHDYEGKLNHAMTAHPKIDAETNELMFFCYGATTPYLTYAVINAEGKYVHKAEINIPTPVMMHDFAVTEKYSIFQDFPLEFHPKNMITKGSAYSFNPNRPTRFGVMGRYETNDNVRWFNFAPGFIFHNFNAWEETNEKGETIISIIGCRSDSIDLGVLKLEPPRPHLYTINLTTQETFETSVSDVLCEFPTIHPDKVGKPNQFAYCATMDPTREVMFNGVVKYDLSNYKNGKIEEVGRINYGQNRFGGEAIFVPRKNAKTEDEGYLMTFVYDEKIEESDFVVYDAKTMSEKALVSVTLPQRVPFGFHGLFVEESKLKNQKDYLP